MTPSKLRSIGAASALTVLTMSGAAQAQSARDYISIVGSSTVYPFATVVAEQFGKTSSFKTPTIEATGSGGGLKLFCAGAGIQHPDITSASRRIKRSEVANCAKNGVKDIIEIKVGYDGIVLANAKRTKRYSLTRKDVFMALAKDTPVSYGGSQVGANSARTWADVNGSLPAAEIEVLGPPPTSGTRDAFVELVMEPGCSEIDFIRAWASSDQTKYSSVCHTVREDGAYVEAGENDNLIVRKLEANPDALGIFGFSFLDQNADKVHGALIEGVEPTFENIADGSYPVSRPLYFYVKKAHVGVIPGMQEFLNEVTSAKAWGEDGYLADKGLIPMPQEERARFAKAASQLITLRARDIK